MLFRSGQARKRFLDLAGGKPFQEALEPPTRHVVFAFGGEQLSERNMQRSGDSAEQHDGDVAITRFELGKITLGNIRCLRDAAARHAAAAALLANTLAKKLKKFFVGAGKRGRRGEVGRQ